MSRHLLPPPVTYGSHRSEWADCQACPLCHTRTKVVTFRFHVDGRNVSTRKAHPYFEPSCDILGIGEAPGESEDVRGFPFVGPAGKKLSKCINRALDLLRDNYRVEKRPTIGLTNLVACLPQDDDGLRAPNKLEILHCQPRLDQIVASCKPAWIICFGKPAKNNFPGGFTSSVKNFSLGGISDVLHPSYFLHIENAAMRNTQFALYETELARIFKQWADYVKKVQTRRVS